MDRRSARGTTFALSLLTKLFETETLVEDARFTPMLAEMLLLCQSYKSSRDCPLEKLLSTLNNFLRWVPTFTLLVDALDECNDINADSNRLIRYLLDLGSRPDARVILLSRKHARFDGLFKDNFQVFMDHSAVESDIMHFLKQQIRARGLQALEENILKKASTDCQGMFLWVKMMLDYVEDGFSINARGKRLETFPPELFAVYQRLLEENSANLDHDEVDLRRDIFLLLVGTHEALTVSEISAALALNTEKKVMVEGDKLVNPEATILKLCWPLVMVVNEQAQLIHMSVKDFLLQSQRDQCSPTSTKHYLSSRGFQ